MFNKLSNKELVNVTHGLAKALGADTPLIDIAKLLAESATRLDVAIVRGNELQKQLDAVVAENVALKDGIAKCTAAVEHWNSWADTEDKISLLLEAPATDAILNALRAEGIHFAANRMLAAWDSGFIDDTPAQVYDISGAVLSAVEFLPNASPEEFKRDFADAIRREIKPRNADAAKDGE